MTIINRALTKAYKNRSDADPGDAREQRSASVNGWASELREPLRPIPSPGRTVPERPALPTKPDATSPSAPSQPVARVAAPPVPPATAALLTAPAGTTVRFDRGHVAAKPQAPPETRPAERGSVAGAATIALDTAPRWSWPPIVRKLLDCSAGAELRKLSASLKHLAATDRLGCIVLSGPGRSTGRTSLVLTLAHLLAETQFCRVAIVDADFGHPDAAGLLSLLPRTGLWDAACEKEPAAPVVTPLIAGRLSIVPLVERVAPEDIDRKKIGALQSFLRSLRSEHDLVLVDAGPWESLVPPLVFESPAVDALLCVSRCDGGEERLDDEHYRQPGMEWLGMIETFAPAQQLKNGAGSEPIS